MVAVDTLESSLAKLTDEAAVEVAMVEFAHEQTPFVQYLLGEGFELLTEDERSYLQYLALVMYDAVRTEAGGTVATASGTTIEEWDERCWQWMQETVGKPMHERLDVFFDNINEEELLAFAEDSLIDPDADEADDDLAVFQSGASREMGFVALAVLAGVLREAS